MGNLFVVDKDVSPRRQEGVLRPRRVPHPTSVDEGRVYSDNPSLKGKGPRRGNPGSGIRDRGTGPLPRCDWVSRGWDF